MNLSNYQHHSEVWLMYMTHIVTVEDGAMLLASLDPPTVGGVCVVCMGLGLSLFCLRICWGEESPCGVGGQSRASAVSEHRYLLSYPFLGRRPNVHVCVVSRLNSVTKWSESANSKYLQQTIVAIPQLETRSPHHIGGWTLHVQPSADSSSAAVHVFCRILDFHIPCTIYHMPYTTYSIPYVI